MSAALSLALLGCSSSSATDESGFIPPEETYIESPLSPESANFSVSARAYVEGMGTGWNLGNTLDAHGISGLGTETYWGQPKTTQAMMQGLYDAGIRTVRIPVSWHNHVNAAYTVDVEWMARVREVVDYAIDEGLYVIINIHHDNEEGFYFPDQQHRERSIAYVTRIWKQIALEFRNYDDKLVFELLNEPRLVGYSNEWNWSDSDSLLSKAAELIAEMEQAALDAIRATESNNTERFVMITPYVASPWAALSGKFAIPNDSADDKLILSVHAYTPYVFAMEDPGVKVFMSAHTSDIDNFMGQLNATFVSGKGMPVIIGEYGATNKNNLSDREDWFSYYVAKARSYGMLTVLWDNGNHEVPPSGEFSELYGFYNRTAQSWYFPTILTAILGAL